MLIWKYIKRLLPAFYFLHFLKYDCLFPMQYFYHSDVKLSNILQNQYVCDQYNVLITYFFVSGKLCLIVIVTSAFFGKLLALR